jgi:hypothetical protein
MINTYVEGSARVAARASMSAPTCAEESAGLAVKIPWITVFRVLFRVLFRESACRLSKSLG